MLDDGAQPLYSWAHFHYDARKIIESIRESGATITGVYAIPRGGLCLATVLAHALVVPLYVGHEPERSTQTSVLACDDNTITGDSLRPFAERGMPCAVLVKHPNAPGIQPLFYARESDEMFLFPWEAEAAVEPYPLEDVVGVDAFEPSEGAHVTETDAAAAV